mgnify:FL=1
MAENSVYDRLAAGLAGYFKKDWSGALLAVVILAIGIELVTDGRSFFHPSNIMTILNNSAALGVIAGGMTLVILTAGIDLSVGSVMGMTAALTGYVASYWGFPPILAILFGIALGLSIGLIHGTLIARFGMPAFIVTLAGLSIWRGTGHLTTGAQATPKLDAVFDFFGRYNPLSPLRDGYRDGTLPEVLMPLGKWMDSLWLEYFRTFQMSLVIFIVFFIVLGLIVKHTKLGRYTYAIGSNEQGARQAGIDVRLYKTLAYVVCSFTAAFGALMFLGRAPYAKSDYGQMWELDAIAAVVIGGTSLFGGRGSILGTFLGVILLKLINNGLTLAQLNTFWQMIVLGMIILLAVGIDIVRQNASPMRIKQVLFAIGAAALLFAAMHPASQYFGSLIALHEHNSMQALLALGGQLAPNQVTRVLSSEELIALRDLLDASVWLAWGLLLATAFGIAAIARPTAATASLMIGLLFVSAAGLFMQGLPGLPILLLGLVAILGSYVTDDLFHRAKRPVESDHVAGH